MNISNINNSINFQKKLVATAGILRNKVSENCKIYELDPKEDREYYTKQIQLNDAWNTSRYFKRIDEEIRETGDLAEKFYTLEDKYGNCLVAAITTENYFCNDLEWLASAPNRKADGIKYGGETILTYLAKKSQANGRESFEVPCAANTAVEFYKKSRFNLINPKFPNFSLPKKKYGELLKQNKEHTGIKLKLKG